MGLSGKSLIHTLPPLLIKRVIATRAASICLAVIQWGSNVCSPYVPKATLEPRSGLPFMRPRICFLCFTLFGINMAKISLKRLPVPVSS